MGFCGRNGLEIIPCLAHSCLGEEDSKHDTLRGAEAGKRINMRATHGLGPKTKAPLMTYFFLLEAVLIVVRNAGYTKERWHAGGTHLC